MGDTQATDGNGGTVELDVQETLRAILHTQSRFEVQMMLHTKALQEIMVALHIREKLETIAKDLDEVTPVDVSVAIMGLRNRR